MQAGGRGLESTRASVSKSKGKRVVRFPETRAASGSYAVCSIRNRAPSPHREQLFLHFALEDLNVVAVRDFTFQDGVLQLQIPGLRKDETFVSWYRAGINHCTV